MRSFGIALILASALCSAPAGLAAEGKNKQASEAAAFSAALNAYISQGFPYASAEDQRSMLGCLLPFFDDFAAEERRGLIENAFFVHAPEHMATLLYNHPQLQAAVGGCVPPTAAATNRNVQLSNGETLISIKAGGTASHPNHAGGIYYDNGQLSVAGRRIELPNFTRQLIISVSQDGAVTFEIDP